MEDVEAAVAKIDEEIVYTMENAFDTAAEKDKDDVCDRFDRMFQARPSLLRKSRGLSVQNDCKVYLTKTPVKLSTDGKVIIRIFKNFYAHTHILLKSDYY